MQLFADVTSTTIDTTSLNFILEPTKNFTESLRKIKQIHMSYEGRPDFLKIVGVKKTHWFFRLLERAHITWISSFIELELILSSRKNNFLSLSLSLKTNLPSFCSKISLLSSYTEFKFLKSTNRQIRILSSLKFE